MLNVGSSTDQFRTREQPWIDQYIFRPAREKKQIVVHLDRRTAPGVDIVGDLCDPSFIQSLSGTRFRSVLCTNLLEHVFKKDEICAALAGMLPSGGYIFASCPYAYPWHPDPVDTMFRPDVDELRSMFPNTRLACGELVRCGTYLDYMTRDPVIFTKNIVRLFLPFYNPPGWLTAVHHLPWLFKHFQVTCIVLRRN
jgi:hypothetical protein